MAVEAPVKPDAGLTGHSARTRIALLTYMLSQGGTDRVAAILAKHYAEAGYDVALLVLCDNGTAEPILRSMVGTRVAIRHIGLPTASRSWDQVRLLPALVGILRQTRPHVLISTANNTAWLSTIARKLSGLDATRLVLKTTNPIVGSRHRGPLKTIRLLGYRRVFAAADAVWTLSDCETGLLRRAYPFASDRIRTTVNPYVTDAMLSCTCARGDTPDALQVLGIGRLESQKRFDLLIRAFALVEHPGAQLTILGEGSERGRLERLVTRHGLEGRVSLPGFVPDVSAWLARSVLFVLPSRYEGLPAVVLEAMAANCPVLATDCFAASRELMCDADCCGIVEDADPGLLARLIDERLGARRPTQLQDIAKKYSVARGAADHIAALRALQDVTA